MVDAKIKELEDILNSDIILSQDEINSKLLSIEKHIMKLDTKYNSILSTNYIIDDLDLDIKSIKNKIDNIGDKVNSLINSNKNLEDIIDLYAEYKKELNSLEHSNNEFTDINIEYL